MSNVVIIIIMGISGFFTIFLSSISIKSSHIEILFTIGITFLIVAGLMLCAEFYLNIS